MKFTYKDDPYNVDDGRYLARFKEVVPFVSATAKDKDGNPIPPGLKWVFQIAEGPDTGCLVNKITSATPTKKNSCGRMLQALFDGGIDDGMEIDTGKMVGPVYRITVAEGNVSDNPTPRFVGYSLPNKPQEENGTGGSSGDSGGSEKPAVDEKIPF